MTIFEEFFDIKDIKTIRENLKTKNYLEEIMKLYLKLLLLLFLLALASMKLMLATEKTSENSLKNKDLNTRSTGNHRLFRPEAGINIEIQKMTASAFA